MIWENEIARIAILEQKIDRVIEEDRCKKPWTRRKIKPTVSKNRAENLMSTDRRGEMQEEELEEEEANLKWFGDCLATAPPSELWVTNSNAGRGDSSISVGLCVVLCRWWKKLTLQINPPTLFDFLKPVLFDFNYWVKSCQKKIIEWSIIAIWIYVLNCEDKLNTEKNKLNRQWRSQKLYKTRAKVGLDKWSISFLEILHGESTKFK